MKFDKNDILFLIATVCLWILSSITKDPIASAIYFCTGILINVMRGLKNE